METYKRDNVRPVTYKKYQMTLNRLRSLAPDLELSDTNRAAFQDIITRYCETHEHTTAMDFYHHLKGSLQDAFADGLIDRDPTRRILVKGRAPADKRSKYLSQSELKALLGILDLSSLDGSDALIYLIAKTGMRFAEALGLTPADFNFSNQTVRIEKTWDYKSKSGFAETKNRQSIRTIQLDWQTASVFAKLCEGLDANKPVFIRSGKPIYNSTVNGALSRKCSEAGVPDISVHGLRHTHASILLTAGVSLASVSCRLGHADISVTQKVYMHLIHELEAQDTDLIMRQMSLLTA